MSKAKIYKIERKNYNCNNNERKDDFKSFAISILIYAVVLMIASSLFRNIYVANFLYAIIAALILSFLNYTVKPFLIFLTLPISIVSFGILYPIVNMIMLSWCDMLMGNAFEISGFFASFVISIFISGLRILLDRLIVGKVK